MAVVYIITNVVFVILCAAPEEAPVILDAYNTSAFSIFVNWTAINTTNIRGILRYYRIFYRPVNTTLGPELSFVVSKAKTTIVIRGLLLWTNYTITVAAGTVVDGPRSSPVIASTDDKILPRKLFFVVLLGGRGWRSW